MDVREPAVAGMFYPGTEGALNRELDTLLTPGRERKTAVGVVSPHAGYIYSGAVAGEVFSSVHIPEKVVLLGPSHTGLGARGAVMAKGAWSVPNGTARIDEDLAEELISGCPLLTEDVTAHLHEHSLEVQVPFLIHERPGVKIVPVTLMAFGIDACREIGIALARTIGFRGEDVLIVASSDMTHYESQERAERKDRLAIDKVLHLDPKGLMDVVMENDISMCGVIPVTVMLFAARELGASKASLVRYATSGDVTGDYAQVVGYAGMVVE